MKVSPYLFALLLLGPTHALAQAAPEAAPQVAPTTAQPAATPAKAAVTPEAKADASAHFRRGVELFQEEAFRGALVEFERAYSIAPDYRLLYNIGQAKYETQDYLGATQSYERYLEEGADEITKERRMLVESALAALSERVGTVNVLVNRKGAEVFVDDVSVGFTPLGGVRVNVGRHRISARTPNGATDAEAVSVAGGDTTEVSLTLVDPAVGAVAKETSITTTQKAGIGVWSTAGGALIGALITGLKAKSAQDDLDKLRNTPDVNRSAIEDKHDQAKRLAITTDVLIGVGAASAVTGTLLWVLGRDDEEKSAKSPSATLRLEVGAGKLGMSGTF